VPFPLEEVVWDYQILGSAPSGELEVLLVAIKADIVEGLFRVTEAAGLKLMVADVSPAALCNAFRYNYGDLEDCTMLLDIGAKTCNLLFFEKGKVFSRSINLGANSITQDFANESKLKFEAAEKLKIDEGFVSLGGAYEEPENPHQAAISKIARQFMTRLHIQVNQTMQFYRGQQGGSAPQRLFLSGGASIMPYTAQFFAEKLNVPVEYFNPLRNVQIDPSINLEDLARVAHSMGEVVGLGLRNLAHCPVELNLMPESTLKWQAFNQKKPYFIATVFSLAAGVVAMGFLFDKLAAVKQEELGKIQPKLQEQQLKSDQFKKAYGDLKKTQQEVDKLVSYLSERYYWPDVFTELKSELTRAEETTRIKLRADTGIWIEKLSAPPEGEFALASSGGGTGVGLAPGPEPMPVNKFNPELDRYRGRFPDGAAPAPPPPPADGGAGQPKPSGDQVSTISIIFRAISRTGVQAEANKQTAYQILDEMKNSPYFDPTNTAFSTEISPDEPPGTFWFGITNTLKHPLKL
jgi:type IV pilus assembly protein PilM